MVLSSEALNKGLGLKVAADLRRVRRIGLEFGRRCQLSTCSLLAWGNIGASVLFCFLRLSRISFTHKPEIPTKFRSLDQRSVGKTNMGMHEREAILRSISAISFSRKPGWEKNTFGLETACGRRVWRKYFCRMKYMPMSSTKPQSEVLPQESAGIMFWEVEYALWFGPTMNQG